MAAAITPTITATTTFLHHRHNDTSSLHRSSSLSFTSSRTISSSSVLQFTPKCLANPLFSAPAAEKKQKSSVRTEAVRQLTGSLTKAQGHRFAIVIARFNEIVTRPLMNGALDTFDKYSVREEDIDIIWVPGVFEIGVILPTMKTCEDMDQALNRAGGKAGNKGSEAALTAIEMASLFEHHLKE
ncbi:6,7-dimethyl-8-ribityllumazine synthase, chloroplastic-like protein [Tanacetum coccineum]